MKYFFRLFGLLALVLAQQPALAQGIRWLDNQAYQRDSAAYPNWCIWQISGSPDCVLDDAGNAITLGEAGGSYRLGSNTYPLPGGRAYMVGVKYDPDGNILWHRPLVLLDTAANSMVTFVGARTDGAGNLYAAFELAGSMSLDGQVISAPAGQARWAVVIAKWSPTGVLRWVRKGDNGINRAYLSVDRAGNAYLAGMYQRTITLGAFSASAGAANAGYCAKLDSAGTCQWLKGFDAHSFPYDIIAGVGADSLGNVYVTGASMCTMDGRTIPAVGTVDNGFWLKLSSSGQYLHDILLPSVGGNMFAVDEGGYSYLAGIVPTDPMDVGNARFYPGNNDSYVLRLNPQGIPQWFQPLRTGVEGSWQYSGLNNLRLDADDHVFLTGNWGNDTVKIGPFVRDSPVHPQNEDSDGYLAALDGVTGQPLWVQWIMGQLNEAVTYLAVNRRGNILCSGFSESDSTYLGGQMVYAPLDSMGAPSKQFIERLSFDYNTIRGAVFVDTNANGLRDAGESGPTPGAVVEATPGGAFAVTATGDYRATVPLGTVGIGMPTPPPYYTVVASGPATATFSTYGNVAVGPSFALQPIANQQDVQVWLTQVSPARPGFPATYDLQYRNVGTVPISSGLLTLTPDARLTYTSSAPAATVAGGSLLWAYANLAPGETRQLRAVFSLATTAGLGTMLSSTATLTPLAGDLEPADNTATATRIVTGSFDPNDISVNHVTLNTTQTAAGEWLEYTIRFQNHGTDTAFTVLLIDSLPTNLLRLSTLLPLAGSHSFGWSISPRGQLLIRFTDIKLPPQATNLLDSEGFVRFHVRPAATLAAGDEIPNQAQIHFDYNAPMATNTARTRIQSTTARPEDAADAAAGLTVWPNPASGGTPLRISGAAPAAGLVLADMCGRAVAVTTADAAGEAKLSTAGLAAGVYVLRGTGTARRVVVR